jgi:hypothetical protein
MAQYITWSAKFLPPPSRKGSQGSAAKSASDVPAERGVAIIVEGIQEYSNAIKKSAKIVLNQTAAAIATDARESADGPGGRFVYLGKLRQSIRGPLPDGDLGVKVVMGGAAAPYAPFFEYGTRSGKPSIEAIMHWMKRKGIAPKPPNTTIRQAAGAIQKKIMRTGTPAHPSLFPAFEKHRQEFIDKMRAIL